VQTNPINNLRLALYARVSGEEQREGQTIDSQIEELRRFAEQNGWLVLYLYADDGWVGSVLARPALDRLRDDARKGLFDAVLINDVDRLARDVTHLGVIKRDLEGVGIRVLFKKLPAENSPMRNLMVNILGSFAEFEREMIADRTRRGRRHKVEVRKQFLGTVAAYGLRYLRKDRAAGREGHLEIAREEAAIVRDIYRWVDCEGLSARKVVNRLTALRVPTPKGGAAWQRSTVLRILRSEVYAGIWHYNKHERHEPAARAESARYRRSTKTSLRLRPRQEWLPVILPEQLRIITRDRWQRVQQQLDRNRVFSLRNSKHTYLLKGLVKCSGCSKTYVGEPVHGKFYYRCGARCRRLPSVREEDLVNAVWPAVEEAVLNPAVIEDQVEKWMARREQKAEEAVSEAREVLVLLKRLEEEESRLLEAYRTGILPAAVLGRELEKLAARRAPLELRKGAVPPPVTKADLSGIKRAVRYYCDFAAQRLRTLEFAGRQSFLRLLVKDILFEGSKVVIRGRIPMTDGPPVEAVRDRATTADGTPSETAGVVSHIVPLATYHHGRNSAGSFEFDLVRPILRGPSQHTRQSGKRAAGKRAA